DVISCQLIQVSAAVLIVLSGLVTEMDYYPLNSLLVQRALQPILIHAYLQSYPIVVAAPLLILLYILANSIENDNHYQDYAKYRNVTLLSLFYHFFLMDQYQSALILTFQILV